MHLNERVFCFGNYHFQSKDDAKSKSKTQGLSFSATSSSTMKTYIELIQRETSFKFSVIYLQMKYSKKTKAI